MDYPYSFRVLSGRDVTEDGAGNYFFGAGCAAGMGAGLAVTSLLRKEGRPWLAISGVILNGSFALFQSAILAFAG